MGSRLSIFHPLPRLALPNNPFGKDIANLELLQALARHGGYEQVDILGVRAGDPDDLSRSLFGDGAPAARVTAGSILNQQAPAQSGALFRGQPDLYNLAWLRRQAVGDKAYSLVGLVHTLAPPAMRQIIAMASVAPTHPWDAIVCTSPSVRDGLVRMFDTWGGYLAERTGGTPPPRPALPVVPLGVDGRRFAALADRPEARASVRARLGLEEADVLALWVGRLSYYEKAFPQAMFQAVRRAAEATGAKVHFALAGWFPHESDRERFEASAQRHAQGVEIHFLDGNDSALLGELWAGADLFISLVDNIQETFGITPLEAMAAGLPVVVSDWDGYRFTVRDGVEGFLIPTLGGPATGGLGAVMAQRHILEAMSYQSYVGEVAQYTAVHVGRAAEAIAALIRSPDLRRTMGAAGRERIRTALDWPIVGRQLRALTDEMDAIRAAAPAVDVRYTSDPVRGDPFVDFAGFPTQVLRTDTPLRAAAGSTGADVLAIPYGLDVGFPGLRADVAECARALDLLASGQAKTSADVLLAFPVERRRLVETGLAWMAKLGFVDWLD